MLVVKSGIHAVDSVADLGSWTGLATCSTNSKDKKKSSNVILALGLYSVITALFALPLAARRNGFKRSPSRSPHPWSLGYIRTSILAMILANGTGSPAHLAIAKEELEAAYHASHRKTISKGTQISGPTDDPIVEGRVEGRGKGGDDELVIMIAGGMTSQLTYDGVDVCASRVAYEVSSGSDPAYQLELRMQGMEADGVLGR